MSDQVTSHSSPNHEPAPTAGGYEQQVRLPRDVLSLLAALFLLLFLFQFGSMPRLAFTIGLRWSLADYAQNLLRVPWSTIDISLMTGIAGCLLALISLECHSNRVSNFLLRVFESERNTLILTALASLAAVRYYFSPGYNTWGGDASFHYLYAWIASEGLSQGLFPTWTPVISAGSPFLQFYGPVFFYTVALLERIFGDIEVAIKAVIGLSHAASGITCYLYVRMLTGQRRLGFFAGLCYVLSFWHLYQVLIMGRYPVAIIYALLPLPFYALERLRGENQDRLTSLVIGTLSLALLTFTHPGYAFWVVVFLLIYIVVGLRGNGVALWSDAARVIGGGIFLGSCLILPMWVEREWTGLYKGFSLLYQGVPTLEHLLVWSNHRTRLIPFSEHADHWYGGYLGISLVLLSAAGLALVVMRRSFKPGRHFAWIGLALSLFLVFGSRLPILIDLDVIKAMGSARYLLFAVFFLSVSAALGLSAILNFPGTRMMYVLALGIVAVDLGSTTIRQPYHFLDHKNSGTLNQNYYDALMRYQTVLRPHQFVPIRIYHTHDSTNNYLTKLGRFSSSKGLYDEHPKADWDFIRPFFGQLRQELTKAEGDFLKTRPGQTASHGLYLLNTRHYLHRKSGTGDIHIDLDEVSPIVVSNKLVYLDLDLDLDPEDRAFRIVEDMGLDPAESRCDQILVPSESKESVLPGEPVVRLIDHQVWVDRTSFRFEVSQAAYARLSYAYYPYLDIRLNEEPLDYFSTAEGFIGVTLPPGKHTIQIRGRTSPLRKSVLAVVILVTGFCVALILRQRQKPVIKDHHRSH